MSPGKKTHFNISWLNEPKYANWLVSTSDSNYLRCKLCNKTLTLSNMLKGALESHMGAKNTKI